MNGNFYISLSFMLQKRFVVSVLSILIAAIVIQAVNAQTNPTELPLLHQNDFHYVGAFRLPDDTFGVSDLNYSEGPLEYNAANHSIYIVGHSHHQALAEFAVPTLVCSADIADLKMSGVPLQSFAEILTRTTGGNPQNLNRIGGLELIPGSTGLALIVNAYEYYDAPGDNTQTSAVVREGGDIAGSTIDGFYEFQGGAGHTSGWISPIPTEWQAALGGTHITGHSSGIPIISRTSVGPSALAFKGLADFSSESISIPVPTVKLLDFSLSHPLHDDLSNTSGYQIIDVP